MDPGPLEDMLQVNLDCARLDPERAGNLTIAKTLLDQLPARPASGHNIVKIAAKAFKRRYGQFGFRRKLPRQFRQNRTGADQILHTGAKRIVAPAFPRRNQRYPRA